MFDCLIVGDSNGVELHFEVMHEDCHLVSKGWMTTERFNREFPGQFYANTVIISLGMYDYKGINTEDELHKMRERVGAKNVFWMLPIMNVVGFKIPNYWERSVPIEKIQKIVKDIAAQYGDTVISTPKNEVTTVGEGASPSNYGLKQIARKVMEGKAGIEVFPVTP